MAVTVARHRFSVVEYNQMGEAGVFHENDRLELIEGDIIEMSPIGKRHAACVKRLNTILTRQGQGNWIVGVQDPIQLDDFSEPQPDLSLVKFRPDYYQQRHPTPADIL